MMFALFSVLFIIVGGGVHSTVQQEYLTYSTNIGASVDAGGGSSIGDPSHDDLLAQVRKNLLIILYAKIVDIIIGVIKAFLSGKPLDIVFDNLQSELKSLATGQLTGTNPKANKQQINKALNQIQAAVSTILKPQVVKVIIDLIKQLRIGGPINPILQSVNNVLSSIGLGAIGVTNDGRIDGEVSVDSSTLDDLLVQIRNILLIISPATTVDIIIDVIKALLNGKPLDVAFNSLQSALKSLTTGKLIGTNKYVRKRQLYKALNQIQAATSTVLKPQIVKVVIDVIKRLLIGGRIDAILEDLNAILEGVTSGAYDVEVSGGGDDGDGNPSSDDLLAQIKNTLLTILPATTVDIIIVVIKAFLSGKPLDVVFNNLQIVLKSLASGQLTGANPEVSQDQINTALNQIQTALSIVLKPPIVKVVIDVIKQLLVDEPIDAIIQSLNNMLSDVTGDAADGDVGGNGSVDGVLEKIRTILEPILSPDPIDIIIDLAKALLTGKPLAVVFDKLQSVAKSLTSGDLPPGVLGQSTDPNSELSEEQINAALNQVQAALSTVVKPKLVKTVIDILKRLLFGGSIKALLQSLNSSLGSISHGAIGATNDGRIGGGVRAGGNTPPSNGDNPTAGIGSLLDALLDVLLGDDGLLSGLLNGLLGEDGILGGLLG